jgi:hypothetical protein
MNFNSFNVNDTFMLIVAVLLWAATCLHQGFHAFARAADAAVDWLAAGWRRWASSLSPESVGRFEEAVLWFRLLSDLVATSCGGGALVAMVTVVGAGLSIACALIQKARR